MSDQGGEVILMRGELREVSRAASKLLLKCYTCGLTAQVNVAGDQEQDDVLKKHGWRSKMISDAETSIGKEVWICGHKHPTLDEMKGWRFMSQDGLLFFGSAEFPRMMVSVAVFSSAGTEEENDKAVNRCAVIAEQLNLIVGVGDHDWPESMGCN